jgi:predicted RNase H-like nuclease (RuvC/YqgF family)
MLNNSNKVLHSNINLLKKQLKEAQQTIRQLRRELAEAKQDNAGQNRGTWVELMEKDI